MLLGVIRRWFAIPLAVRLGICVWVGVLAVVSGRIFLARPTSGTVVPIYLTAGQRWLASADLYAQIPGWDVYRNPPGVAAVFAALAELPNPRHAGLLWRTISVTVFLVGLVRFRRAIAPDLSPARHGWYLALSAVIALPAVNNGQVNILIAGAGLNAAAMVATSRWWKSASWLALATGLKLYPLAAGLLFAAWAPRKLTLRLAVCIAGLFAVPFVLQNPVYVAEQYANFVSYLGTDNRTYANWDRIPRDWTIVPRAWFGWEVPSQTLAGDVSVVAGLVMLWLAVGFAVRTSDRAAAAGFTLLLGSVWMTLFGPATEANTYSLLAGVAAWQTVHPGPRPRWASAFIYTGIGLLLATVLRGVVPGDKDFNAMGPQAVGTALLWIGGSVQAIVAARTVPVPTSEVIAARLKASQPPRLRLGVETLSQV